MTPEQWSRQCMHDFARAVNQTKIKNQKESLHLEHGAITLVGGATQHKQSNTLLRFASDGGPHPAWIAKESKFQWHHSTPLATQHRGWHRHRHSGCAIHQKERECVARCSLAECLPRHGTAVRARSTVRRAIRPPVPFRKRIVASEV